MTNLASIAAAFGDRPSSIFQDGHLSGILHFTPQGFVDAWGPLFFGAMLSGVAMDYTLFLLSAAREHYDPPATRSTPCGWRCGTSGRVVISAAGVMVAVFLTFALSGPLAPKEMGIILAVAVVPRRPARPPRPAPRHAPPRPGTPPGTAPPGSTGSSPTSASPTDPKINHMTTRTLQRPADPADPVLLAGTVTLTGILLGVTRHASSRRWRASPPEPAPPGTPVSSARCSTRHRRRWGWAAPATAPSSASGPATPSCAHPDEDHWHSGAADAFMCHHARGTARQRRPHHVPGSP